MSLNHLANIDLIVLFFFLGGFASWIKSDLQIPDQVSKFLSVFLLLSLGLKGGHEVRIASDLSGLLPILGIGIASCLIIPVYLFYFYRKSLGTANSAALACCFGSVSAVTFIAAHGFLQNEQIPSSGFMVAIMALMEVPAIVMGLFLHRKYKKSNSKDEVAYVGASIFSAKSVVLLLGGFTIGILMNQSSWISIKPVVSDSFKGLLAFFLLDLGIHAQKQLRDAWLHKWKALVIAIVLPLAHGSIALIAAHYLGIEQGNQILLAVLVGSASYIAAPAAIRAGISDANASLYMALPLALTFPMNILVGIPLYVELSKLIV